MIIDNLFSKKLAKALLEINAVVLRPSDPFTWSSGWNSPIYCDNRLTLLYPELRRDIANQFSNCCRVGSPNWVTPEIMRPRIVAEGLEVLMTLVLDQADADRVVCAIQHSYHEQCREVCVQESKASVTYK